MKIFNKRNYYLFSNIITQEHFILFFFKPDKLIKQIFYLYNSGRFHMKMLVEMHVLFKFQFKPKYFGTKEF